MNQGVGVPGDWGCYFYQASEQPLLRRHGPSLGPILRGLAMFGIQDPTLQFAAFGGGLPQDWAPSGPSRLVASGAMGCVLFFSWV